MSLIVVGMRASESVGEQVFVVFEGLYIYGTTLVRVRNIFKEGSCT